MLNHEMTQGNYYTDVIGSGTNSEKDMLKTHKHWSQLGGRQHIRTGLGQARDLHVSQSVWSS